MIAVTAASQRRSDSSGISRRALDQRVWSEDEYLAYDENRLIEFSDGNVEELPMPTSSHQFIMLAFYGLLAAFVTPQRAGRVTVAPIKLRIAPKRYREPDVMFLRTIRSKEIGEQFWSGADLVMEVVSPSNPNHDLVTKRSEYAVSGISEYWIIDPRTRRVTVLALQGQEYVEHGQFNAGEIATSLLLPGFEVDVSAVFAAAVVNE